MSWWKSAESEAMLLTAAIITRAAEGVAAEVHTRMPVILPKEAEAAWIDREQTDGVKALEQAQAVAVTELEYHAVSTRVNSVKNKGMDLIEPFPNPA
jgi:putative SOS response-associated peptidase YedK